MTGDHEALRFCLLPWLTVLNRNDFLKNDVIVDIFVSG